MTCPNCGFASERVFNRCTGCGLPVPSGVAVVRRDPAAVTSGVRWGVLVATILLPPIGIALGIHYSLDPRAPQQELGRTWLATGVVFAVAYALLIATLKAA